MTRDKDFGDLIFRRGLISSGVVLVRAGWSNSRAFVAIVAWLIDTHGDRLEGRYTVVDNEKVRMRALLRTV